MKTFLSVLDLEEKMVCFEAEITSRASSSRVLSDRESLLRRETSHKYFTRGLNFGFTSSLKDT